MESEYLRAEKKALELIARAEQCSAGLQRKLEMRGVTPEIAVQVISSLTEQKLIDDSRYARLWLQTRVRLTRTPRRLLAGLCNRGIPCEEAQTALDSVLDEETETALLERFVKKQKKIKSTKTSDDQLKYLLKNEGFSKAAIQKYTNSC